MMTIVRCAMLVLGFLAALPATGQEPPAGLWEGKFNAMQPPAALTIDFDSRLVSVNGMTALPLTVGLPGDPAAVQFSFTFAGRTVTFIGKRDRSAIAGTLAGGPLSLTPAAAGAPRPAGRRRYPLPAVSSADGLAVVKARAMVTELFQKNELPGVSVAVARHGTVLWSEGFGMADVEQGVPVTPLTRFRAGSVSKVLTAAGLALLIEDGTLDLDAAVQRYVPGFPVKPWPITTRQLAAHTAGIRHYRDTELTGPKGAPHFSSVLDALELFKNDPLLFEPGKGYSYSSYGWTLVSAVIEGASGQEFLSYMHNRVFEPLGLHSIGPDHVDAIIPHRTRFYTREAQGRPLEHAPYVDPSYVWAAGGFLATAEDLVRFGSAHLSPGLFKPATLELLFKGQTAIPSGNQTAVGIGWRIGKDSTGRRILHHAGASQGGRAVLLMYPESGIVVAMLSNILAPFGDQDVQRIGALFIAR